MDKESLGSKSHGKIGLTYPNIEELKQIQEDLNVEHYSSGSDIEDTSEISLTVEDGTKDLMKNKGNFTIAFVISLNNELSYVKYV